MILNIYLGLYSLNLRESLTISELSSLLFIDTNDIIMLNQKPVICIDKIKDYRSFITNYSNIYHKFNNLPLNFPEDIPMGLVLFLNSRNLIELYVDEGLPNGVISTFDLIKSSIENNNFDKSTIATFTLDITQNEILITDLFSGVKIELEKSIFKKKLENLKLTFDQFIKNENIYPSQP